MFIFHVATKCGVNTFYSYVICNISTCIILHCELLVLCEKKESKEWFYEFFSWFTSFNAAFTYVKSSDAQKSLWNRIDLNVTQDFIK